MTKRLRILFLPRWYPHRYDPMPGLFIQRQAEALASHCDVAVIYVHPDPDCPVALETDFATENGVRVMRIYYRTGGESASFFTRSRDLVNFFRVYRRAYRSIRGFEPDIVHAHILTRVAVAGWLIARKQHSPLVISEHWSRYLPGNNTYSGWFRKLITRWVTRRAAALTAVSGTLREAMQRCGIRHPVFSVIPNVVEPAGRPAGADQPPADARTMVHISCFDDRSKNISGFLRSVKALRAKRDDFNLLMVGEGPDFERLKEMAVSLGLDAPAVQFTGLKTGQGLDDVLNLADFTVLSSRYETFGTVVIESLVRGIPVVATAVGVAPDEIGESNGILVAPGDEEAMTAALDRMLDRCRTFDRGKIRQAIAERYSSRVIAEQLMEVYSAAGSRRHE